jgi:nucleotide-binding universal stress UspA family protein
MFPWRRILVPTDFSTAAKWAFDDAVQASSSTGAELLILHVRIPSHSGELRFDPGVYDYVERHELDVLKRHAHAANADVLTQLIVRVSSDPAKAILECAKDEQVDLIVLSAHARHHVAHLLIGSTTLRILGSCKVPVLAVRYGIRRRETIRRIAALGTATAAVSLAQQIAIHEQALLDVVDDVGESDADLLVIPSECLPDGRLTRAGQEVVRHADVPVLVVPEQ